MSYNARRNLLGLALMAVAYAAFAGIGALVGASREMSVPAWAVVAMVVGFAATKDNRRGRCDSRSDS